MIKSYLSRALSLFVLSFLLAVNVQASKNELHTITSCNSNNTKEIYNINSLCINDEVIMRKNLLDTYGANNVEYFTKSRIYKNIKSFNNNSIITWEITADDDKIYVYKDLKKTSIVGKLTHLYTGNGSTNALNLGVGFIDFTVNNSVGAWLDRSGGAGTFGTFKDDSNNTITSFDIALPQDKFIGAFDIKNRNGGGTEKHINVTSLQGTTKYLHSDASNAEATDTNYVTSITSTGVTVGTSSWINAPGENHVLEATIYTHVKGGVTGGVRWIEAYNPITRNGLRLREGGNSAINMPHSLGKEIAFSITKRLDSTDGGRVYYGDKDRNLWLHSVIGNSQSTPTDGWLNQKPTDTYFSIKGNERGINQAGGVFLDRYFDLSTENRTQK